MDPPGSGKKRLAVIADNAKPRGRCVMAHHCPISGETILGMDADLMFVHASGPLVAYIEAKLGRPLLGLTSNDVFGMFGAVEGHEGNPVLACLDGRAVSWQRPVGDRTISCWAYPKYDHDRIVGVVMHMTSAPVRVTA